MSRFFKGALRGIILAPAMHNRVSAIPAGFLVYPLKEAQMLRPNMRSLFTYIVEFLLKAKPQAEGDLVTT